MTSAPPATELLTSADELVDRLMQRYVTEIPALSQLDPRLRALLHASTHDNVTAATDMVVHERPPDTIETPAAALLLARRLAQRDVPLSAVLRAYRLGQAAFIHEAMQRAAATSPPEGYMAAVLEIVVRTAAYVDRVCEEVSDVHEHERDRWVRRRGAMLGRHVRQVVDGTFVDVDEAQAVIGYDLAGVHVAAVAWTAPDETHADLTDVEALGRRIAVALGGQDHLAVPVDDHELWLWVRLARATGSTVPGPLAAMVESASLPHLAVGTVRDGIEGFRESHREAQLTKAVAMRSRGRPGRVTTFEEVGPVALLSHDADAVRIWVSQVLGPLAAEGKRETWLRDSLRVFLECDGSHAAAAERLQLHRNTVQYRVRRAEELRGRPLDDDRLHVYLALTATQWLGAVVTGSRSP